MDLSHEGSYEVRAKDKLTIHGMEQEHIIRCRLDCSKDKIIISSDLTVPLADHNIKISRIVVAKLATDNRQYIIQLKAIGRNENLQQGTGDHYA